MKLVPLTRDAANAFVKDTHRHHGEVVGHCFALGAIGPTGELCGVAIVGRTKARGYKVGETAEVTRLSTDGTPNACSFLLGACRRAAKALGYARLITYTLASEPGTSLRAAGWVRETTVRGRSWDCASRPRTDSHPLEDKVRWRAA